MSSRIEAKPAAIAMPLQKDRQVSPLRMKITLLIAGFGPLLAIGLFLQSKGFFG
ncbi:hypothetical protein [Synechococcus sp. BS56D]|jgi:hypothetical protein|uniref:hypothetical protein n=1 Tax=Synechococcus sp. BS56D TaxID=2055944 RepID=UPI0013A5EAD7|nr:hypothetical protein [Synechococcus sp. BS56D]